MATIPQGAFAACKVRNNNERAVSMREEKDRPGKESVFNSRPLLEGKPRLQARDTVLIN